MIAVRYRALAMGGLALAALGPEPSLADGPAPGRVRAALAPAPGPSAGRRDYVYQDGAVYAVTTKPGRVTDIVLQPGERLVGTGPIAAGDTARWVIGDTISGEGETRRVHVMLKPIQAGLATNLIINTDRRTYHLDLQSTSRDWVWQVAWRYPAAPAASAPPAASALPIPALNFSYSIVGPRTPWRPLRAFDDGARTYIEFGPTIVLTDLPPLFGVASDGKTSELVNYRVSGRRIIVDRVMDRAELRIGQGRSERRVRILRDGGQ